jgi:hypothetical protein
MLLGVELERARARIALLVSEARRGRSDYVDFGTAREPYAAQSAGSSFPMAPGASTTATTPRFLRQAGATAAGVAGGALLFRGVEEILTPHGGEFAGSTFLPAPKTSLSTTTTQASRVPSMRQAKVATATVMTLRMRMKILSEPAQTPATATAVEAANECIG